MTSSSPLGTSRRASSRSPASTGPHVFYESGLAINVLWTLDDGGKRAVGFKLSDDMEVPEELSAFKFARSQSSPT